MTKEDLFLAIGQVEGSRLLRSELTVQLSSDEQRVGTKMKKTRMHMGRILRNALIAAIIVSMLGVTAYAVGAYLIFDSPEDMISSIFGNKTGYDHSEGSVTPFEDGINVVIEPTFDRVPADEEVVAEEVAPLVNPVGQSISWNGYTLTVDANMYDSVTQCGLLTYTLENPDGLNYSLQSTGEVWFSGGEIVDFSQYGYSYIIQDQSNDTKLTATYYYQLRDKESTDLEIGFSQWATISVTEHRKKLVDLKQELKQNVSEEDVVAYLKQKLGEEYAVIEAELSREEIIEAGYDAMVYEKVDKIATSSDKITIPAVSSGEMTNITLGGGAAILSPVAITLKMPEIENFPERNFGLVKIRFADDTEYVVLDGYVLNHVFAVEDGEGRETTFMFNRIIDVNKVTSVVVDGNIELGID